MGYEVTTADGTTELVADADTYLQEGPLTTFFRTEPGRRVVDCWSVRLASFRTSEVVRIRRIDDVMKALRSLPLAEYASKDDVTKALAP